MLNLDKFDTWIRADYHKRVFGLPILAALIYVALGVSIGFVRPVAMSVVYPWFIMILLSLTNNKRPRLVTSFLFMFFFSASGFVALYIPVSVADLTDNLALRHAEEEVASSVGGGVINDFRRMQQERTISAINQIVADTKNAVLKNAADTSRLPRTFAQKILKPENQQLLEATLTPEQWSDVRGLALLIEQTPNAGRLAKSTKWLTPVTSLSKMATVGTGAHYGGTEGAMLGLAGEQLAEMGLNYGKARALLNPLALIERPSALDVVAGVPRTPPPSEPPTAISAAEAGSAPPATAPSLGSANMRILPTRGEVLGKIQEMGQEQAATVDALGNKIGEAGTAVARKAQPMVLSSALGAAPVSEVPLPPTARVVAQQQAPKSLASLAETGGGVSYVNPQAPTAPARVPTPSKVAPITTDALTHDMKVAATLDKILENTAGLSPEKQALVAQTRRALRKAPLNTPELEEMLQSDPVLREAVAKAQQMNPIEGVPQPAKPMRAPLKPGETSPEMAAFQEANQSASQRFQGVRGTETPAPTSLQESASRRFKGVAETLPGAIKEPTPFAYKVEVKPNSKDSFGVTIPTKPEFTGGDPVVHQKQLEIFEETTKKWSELPEPIREALESPEGLRLSAQATPKIKSTYRSGNQEARLAPMGIERALQHIEAGKTNSPAALDLYDSLARIAEGLKANNPNHNFYAELGEVSTDPKALTALLRKYKEYLPPPAPPVQGKSLASLAQDFNKYQNQKKALNMLVPFKKMEGNVAEIDKQLASLIEQITDNAERAAITKQGGRLKVGLKSLSDQFVRLKEKQIDSKLLAHDVLQPVTGINAVADMLTTLIEDNPNVIPAVKEGVLQSLKTLRSHSDDVTRQIKDIQKSRGK